MKKIGFGLLALTIIALIAFFGFAGSIVDKSMNVCLHISDDDYEISEEAQAMHEGLVIADLHSDVLLWDRSITERGKSGHTDIPRLKEGNFTLQVFDAVIKTPKGQNYESNTGETDNITMLAMANRWPRKTWSSLLERALYQSKKLYKAAHQYNGNFTVITSAKELGALLQNRDMNQKQLGGLLSIEGLHALEGKIENLQKLYDAGYRMMGPVHFFDNKVGGSSAGNEQYGLTEFGREVIQKMDQMEITIDLAHSSNKLIDDILELTTRPVIVSHTGVKGTYDSPRNLSDDQIKRIAENGGLIGIGFWDGAIGDPAVINIVKTMRYVIDLVGIDHVALGSDWDGGTTTYFDAAHIAILTQTLMEEGFTKDEIRNIMGANVIKFFLKNLPRT